MDDRIVQVGIAVFDGPVLVDEWNSLVNPAGKKLHPRAAEVNGLSDDMLVGYPTFEEEAEQRLREMTEDRLVVAHRLPFDASFWAESCLRLGLEPPSRHGICSKVLCAAAGLKGPLLEIATRLHIDFVGNDHDAANDAIASVRVAKRLASDFGGMEKTLAVHEHWATERVNEVNYYSNQQQRDMYAMAHGHQVAV